MKSFVGQGNSSRKSENIAKSFANILWKFCEFKFSPKPQHNLQYGLLKVLFKQIIYLSLGFKSSSGLFSSNWEAFSFVNVFNYL